MLSKYLVGFSILTYIVMTSAEKSIPGLDFALLVVVFPNPSNKVLKALLRRR